jgi:hypothetical protein
VVPLRSIEARLGDRRYSSYSFLTSALGGGEWSASRPGRALPPGKEPPVPTVQEAGWAPDSNTVQRIVEEKLFCPKAFNRSQTLAKYERHLTGRLEGSDNLHFPVQVSRP